MTLNFLRSIFTSSKHSRLLSHKSDSRIANDCLSVSHHNPSASICVNIHEFLKPSHSTAISVIMILVELLYSYLQWSWYLVESWFVHHTLEVDPLVLHTLEVNPLSSLC